MKNNPNILIFTNFPNWAHCGGGLMILLRNIIGGSQFCYEMSHKGGGGQKWANFTLRN